MRLFIVLLLCLALATCSSQLPLAQVLTPASAELTGKRSFSLIAAEQAVAGHMPFAERYAQLEQLLRAGLSARGYQANPQAEIQVYYWLAVQDSPLEFKVDAAPPTPLGPYQAIHRLRDETGTLRIRLTTGGHPRTAPPLGGSDQHRPEPSQGQRRTARTRHPGTVAADSRSSPLAGSS